MRADNGGLARTLGHRLREAREAAGLSLDKLSAAVGTDKGSLSRMEHGLFGSVRLSLLDALATKLGVAPGTLLRKTS